MPTTSSRDGEWPDVPCYELVVHPGMSFRPVVMLLDDVPVPSTMWHRERDSLYVHPDLDIAHISVRTMDRGEERYAKS